jgi:rod shape determining protein RodA
LALPEGLPKDAADRFSRPQRRPAGVGLPIIQSKFAIGSGMLFGKGLFAGTQSQLNFLPENHTDFIFAVIGEELGFVGALVILVLYLLLLYRGVKIAGESRDSFGMLLATGITSMMTFHVLVNVGMTAALCRSRASAAADELRVSSLTTNLIGIGILLNIYMRRQKISFGE